MPRPTFDPSIYSLSRDKSTGTATVTFDPRKGTTQGADRVGRSAFHVPARKVAHEAHSTPRIISRNPLRFVKTEHVTRTYAVPNWTK